MKTNTLISRLVMLAIAGITFILMACPTSETKDGVPVLNIVIDQENDSLLDYDTLIIKVYSKDSSFVQEVFHSKLTDPNQVMGIDLDPRVGKEFRVSITGYKDQKIGFNKEFTLISQNKAETRTLPIDTIKVDARLPELIGLSDTSISEGDSLRIMVSVLNPWNDARLTLKDPPTGARVDTTDLSTGNASILWRPDFNQGKGEQYVLTLLYATNDRQVEKKISVRVLNVNRPPRIAAIANQQVKENETLTFRVEASDPDHDSLVLSAENLPSGAQFTAGTFTWKPQVGQAGTFFIKIRANDGAAVDSTEFAVSVGNVLPPPGRPVVTGITPTNDQTPAWTWSSGGGGTGNFRYRLDNEDLSAATPTRDTLYIPPSELSEATHTLYVQEVNADGIWSLVSRYSIRVDTTPPNPPTVQVSASSPSNNPKPTWTWTTGNVGGTGDFRYKLGDLNLSAGATNTRATVFTPTNNLQAGMRILYVQERDSAGNWSAAGSAGVMLDFTPPAVPNITTVQSSPTNSAKPTWNISGAGGGMGVFRVKLNDSSLSQGAKTGAFDTFTPESNLSSGIHTLYAQESDSAGNWSGTQSRSITVDLIPPSAPIFDSLPLSPLNTLQPEWTWKSGAGGASIFRIKVDDTNWVQSDTLKIGKFKPTSALGAGQHTLFVQGMDSAGNWSVTAKKSLVLALRGTVGPAGFSPSSAYGLSLKLNKSGVPYVAFKVEENNRLMVMRFNNTSWEQVGSESFYTYDIPHLIFDNAGEAPYVAFADDGHGGKATVIRFNGNSWTIVGRAGFSQTAVGYVRMDLTRTGVPYVGFQEPSSASVMRLSANGNEWEYVGSPEFSPGTAGNPSFSLSPTDIPHIAFFDVQNENKATVMRFNGTTWEFVGKAGFTDKLAHMPSLAFSGTGVPYLAFADEAYSNKMSVMRLNGNSWEYVGMPGITSESNAVRWNSLAISATGEPYLAFKDAASAGGASVIRYNGSAWVKVGSGNLTPGEADCISLDLDADGVPFIAYKDGAVGGKATVRKTSFDP